MLWYAMPRSTRLSSPLRQLTIGRNRHPAIAFAALVTIGSVAACDTPPSTEPVAPVFSRESSDPLAAEVRQLAAARGIGALPPVRKVREPLVLLGRALAFDPILSGNRNISCMTCHVPGFGTGDGKSLSIGEGGTGLGPDRVHPQGIFIPRNAPPLFNLGAMRRLFWDGRVEVDDAGTFHTPAGGQLTADMIRVFEFGPVSALALFPVTNRFEMRAFEGNELAAIPDSDFTGIWQALMARLGAIKEYRALFEAAYPGTSFDDMSFAHASNAIGGFFVDRLTTNDSPWDRFLAGGDHALTTRQLQGAKTFMSLKCSICHSGPTFSDQEFHNVAVAQIGPGTGSGASGRDDFGRMSVSNDAVDQYRFRTTPLRNVELTAPYGHDGAILDLRGFIEHYSESHLKLLAFDPSPLEPLLRGTLLPNASDILTTRDPLLEGVVLTEDLVNQLMDYMSALTDDRARNLARITPQRVPSGLPIDR
ncbi:MAG TPA: cytochrome c peroxidase [Longimicrobiales bacterium]|nr:cytochrome c peroxidase [Longimicrobiales bacterium]